MTDIFFSYRSVDRERVRPIRDALAGLGFEVFWDQEVPTGADWDTWIRQHLSKSKCAVVFWSASSVASDNVRHEATVAKLQGKLVAVLLEPLTPDQFPMGLYAQQAINLSDWKGDLDHEGWRKLSRDIEARLTPRWVQRQIYELEAELVAERARREGVENRDRVLQAQIAKEVQAQADLRRERDAVIDELKELKAAVDALKLERTEIETHAKQLRDELERLSISTSAAEAIRVATAGQRQPSNYLPIVGVFAVIAAAAVGYWTHEFISGRAPRLQTQFEPANASSTLTTSIKPPEVQASLPQSSLIPATKRRNVSFVRKTSSEAYGDVASRLALLPVESIDQCEEICRTSLSCTTYTYRRLSGACYLYSAAQLRSNDLFDTGVIAPPPTPAPLLTSSTSTIKSDVEAFGEPVLATDVTARSVQECEQVCLKRNDCTIFTYNKVRQICYLYRKADLKPSTAYDTGVRQ